MRLKRRGSKEVIGDIPQIGRTWGFVLCSLLAGEPSHPKQNPSTKNKAQSSQAFQPGDTQLSGMEQSGPHGSG
jgi:hypothetical protein